MMRRALETRGRSISFLSTTLPTLDRLSAWVLLRQCSEGRFASLFGRSESPMDRSDRETARYSHGPLVVGDWMLSRLYRDEK